MSEQQTWILKFSQDKETFKSGGINERRSGKPIIQVNKTHARMFHFCEEKDFWTNPIPYESLMPGSDCTISAWLWPKDTSLSVVLDYESFMVSGKCNTKWHSLFMKHLQSSTKKKKKKYYLKIHFTEQNYKNQINFHS